MIGYHFTLTKNWENIKRRGLIPYSNLLEEIPHDKMIWLYKKSPKPIILDLCIDRYLRKGARHFVLLKVTYLPEEADQGLRAVHVQEAECSGSYGVQKRQLHAKVPIVIITKRIPPERIERVMEMELKAVVRV